MFNKIYNIMKTVINYLIKLTLLVLFTMLKLGFYYKLEEVKWVQARPKGYILE